VLVLTARDAISDPRCGLQSRRLTTNLSSPLIYGIWWALPCHGAARQRPARQSHQAGAPGL